MKQIEGYIFPWGKIIPSSFIENGVKRVDGDTMYVSSDYSGDNSSSLFDTISVLAVGFDSIAGWNVFRSDIRDKYLPDGRRLSYKKLSDSNRWNALGPFLTSSNLLDGVLVTLVVNKRVGSICYGNSFRDLICNERMLATEWKDVVFEKMVRSIYLVSLIIGEISNPGQNVYWISDDDAIFANQKKSIDLIGLLNVFSSYQVKHPLGRVGVATTTIDERDRLDEDLNAIPDLASGAVAEMATCLAREKGGHIPLGEFNYKHEALSRKSDMIVRWIYSAGYPLKRVVVVFDVNSEGRVYYFKLNIL